MKKVEVYVMIRGDYCAFHEMAFDVVYDVTNNKQIGDYPIEELEDWEFSEYTDCELRSAVLIDGVYYVKW